MAAVSVLAAVAGLLFALAGRHAGRAVIAGALALAATFVLATNSSTHLLHLHYSRGRALAGVQVERWNSFSRVTVRDFGTPDTLLLEIDANSVKKDRLQAIQDDARRTLRGFVTERLRGVTAGDRELREEMRRAWS